MKIRLCRKHIEITINIHIYAEMITIQVNI